MRRTLVLLPLALLAAACGGGSSENELGGGAQFLPPNTVAFVAARGDVDWRQFGRLVLRRAPLVPKDADEVDVAVLQGGKVVVLSRRGKTWSGGGAAPKPSLAETPHYLQALRTVPHDAVAHGYLRGDVTAMRLVGFPGQVRMLIANFGSKVRVIKHPTTRVSIAYLKFGWGAAWQTNDGIDARAHVNGLPLAESNNVRTIQAFVDAYAPALLDEIPGDALRVLDVPLGQSAFQVMATLPRPLRRLFPAVGLPLNQDLDELLGGETALYTRPGGEITLVTSPSDLGLAEEALAELLATRPPALRGFTLHRATIGGQLVVSTKASGIEAFRGGGRKLSADEAFRDAGIPEQVRLLVYERGRQAAWIAPAGADATFTVRFLRQHS